MSLSTYYDVNYKIFKPKVGFEKVYSDKYIKTADAYDPLNKPPTDPNTIETAHTFFKMSDGATTGNINSDTFTINVGHGCNNFKVQSLEEAGLYDLDNITNSGDYVFRVTLYWDGKGNLDGFSIDSADTMDGVFTNVTYRGKKTSNIYDILYFSTSSAKYAELNTNAAKILFKMYLPTDWKYQSYDCYACVLIYLEYTASLNSFKTHVVLQFETLDGGLYNERQVETCKPVYMSDDLPMLRVTGNINSPSFDEFGNSIAKIVTQQVSKTFVTR